MPKPFAATCAKSINSAISARGLKRPGQVDAELAKKGRFYERNQHFHRSAYRAVHDPTAPRDAQGESRGRGVGITKDVPELRADHISTEGSLLGV